MGGESVAAAVTSAEWVATFRTVAVIVAFIVFCYASFAIGIAQGKRSVVDVAATTKNQSGPPNTRRRDTKWLNRK